MRTPQPVDVVERCKACERIDMHGAANRAHDYGPGCDRTGDRVVERKRSTTSGKFAAAGDALGCQIA